MLKINAVFVALVLAVLLILPVVYASPVVIGQLVSPYNLPTHSQITYEVNDLFAKGTYDWVGMEVVFPNGEYDSFMLPMMECWDSEVVDGTTSRWWLEGASAPLRFEVYEYPDCSMDFYYVIDSYDEEIDFEVTFKAMDLDLFQSGGSNYEAFTNTALVRVRAPQEPPQLISGIGTLNIDYNSEFTIDLNNHFSNYDVVEVTWDDLSLYNYSRLQVRNNRYLDISLLGYEFNYETFNVTVSNEYGSVSNTGTIKTGTPLAEPPSWQNIHMLPDIELETVAVGPLQAESYAVMNAYGRNFLDAGVKFYDPSIGEEVLVKMSDFESGAIEHYYDAGAFMVRWDYTELILIPGRDSYAVDEWELILFNDYGNDSITRDFSITNVDYPGLLQPFPDPSEHNVNDQVTFELNNYFSDYDSINISFWNPVDETIDVLSRNIGGTTVTTGSAGVFAASLSTNSANDGLEFYIEGFDNSDFDITVTASNQYGSVSDSFKLIFGDGFAEKLPVKIKELPSPLNMDYNVIENIHVPEYFDSATYNDVWVNFDDPITSEFVTIMSDGVSIYDDPHLYMEITPTDLTIDSKQTDVLTSVTIQAVNEYGATGSAFLLNITPQPPVVHTNIPALYTQDYNMAYAINLDNYVDNYHTVRFEFPDMLDEQGNIYTYTKGDPEIDITNAVASTDGDYWFLISTLLSEQHVIFQHSSKKNFHTDMILTFENNIGQTVVETTYSAMIPPQKINNLPNKIHINDLDGYTFDVSDYVLLVDDLHVGLNNARDGFVDVANFSIYECSKNAPFGTYDFVFQSECLNHYYRNEDTISFALKPGAAQLFESGDLNSVVNDGNPETGFYFSNPYGVVEHTFEEITIDTGDYVTGCTDPSASNYNSDATVDDGSCYILGCTDPSASNYDSSATEDDGSCYILGCMDPEAINYDSSASQHDPDMCVYDEDAPIAQNVTIHYTGSAVYTNTTMTCSWDYSDPEGRPETNTTVRWTADGATIALIDYPSETNTALDTSKFVKNQNIRCVVTPGNNVSRGERAYSSSEPVLNTPPVFDGAIIQPDDPTANENLMCNPTGYYDIDGDSPQVHARFFNALDQVISGWSLGGQLNCGLNEDCERGSQIYCEARVFDGEENSSMTHTSQPVTIINTPPKVNFVTIQPTNRNPANDEDLTCYYEYFDADGDAEQDVEFKWYQGGVETSHTGQIVDSTYTSPSETWRCQARVFDGVDWSQPRNSTLTMIDVDNPRIWKITSSEEIQIDSSEDITWNWRSPHRNNQAYSFFHYLCESDDITENGCLTGEEVCALTTSHDEVSCEVDFTENLSKTLYLQVYDSEGLASQVEPIEWDFETSVGTADLALSVEAGPNYNKYTCEAVNLPSGFNGTAFYSFYYHNIISPVQTESSTPVYYANDYKGMSDKKITCTARLREDGVYSSPFSIDDHLLVNSVSYSSNPELHKQVEVYIEAIGGSLGNQGTDLGSDVNMSLTLRTPFNMIIDGLEAEYSESLESWVYSFSPHIVGDWKVHAVLVEDFNTGQTYRLRGDTIDNTMEVVEAEPRDSEAGGGGGTEEIIQLPSSGNITGYCGDGICQEWEDPFNCWQDCKVNIDTLFTCMWEEDVECNWEQSWFAASLMIFLFGMILISIVYYEARKPR